MEHFGAFDRGLAPSKGIIMRKAIPLLVLLLILGLFWSRPVAAKMKTP